ncbi:Maf family nucleotide pyrophosphatase [uncultured Alistipes sp.]|jgi:septum formation protein|uniref:Maf family nucleotide pyrophosphatase n=1 Tax=uncultured Alistipes sp. TaxID=538949 RepID=UPI002621DC69|nr:Maf family nucleotide pyrophosphatase [uncultured Alistipes sp.]
MLLHERLRNYRLLLASQSPRRRELLSGCGLPYELAPRYACEERYPAGLPAEEVPRYLSRLKSEAYPFPLDERDILLTADTVVVLGDRVLGKPHDRADAVAMLRALAGRSHVVVSGVTLRTVHASHTFTARSEVWFRPLRDEEIDYYVDTCRPYDKAGSYGIQEWLGYVAIERIDGSFYNVMGLPVQRLYVELERFLAAGEGEAQAE